MRKNALIICCVTCVFGAFGAFFRWLLDLTGFEAETGLYIAGNIWSYALLAACGGIAVVLFAIVLNMKRNGRTVLPTDYAAALGGTTAVFRPLYTLLSIIMALGALMLFFTASADLYPAFQYVLALLGIAGAGGFLLMMSAATRRRDPPLNCFGATLLIILYCFWLIVSYRENAATPVVWGYAMELLAIACSLVAFYYVAGIPFGRPKPFAAVYFCQLGAFLCIVTLPDNRLTGQRVMLIATAFMLLLLSWLITANLRAPADKPDDQN